MHLRLHGAAVAAISLLAFAPAANAQLAFDIAGVGGVGAFGSATKTIGYTFNVLTPVSVNELDVLSLPGLPFDSATVPIGLWDSAGNLLTSASISTTAPADDTPSAVVGDFIGTPVAPVLPPAGTYTVGALIDGNDFVLIGPFSSVSSVAFNQAYINTSGSFTQPTSAVGFPAAYAFIGPSFKIADASAVPEPGSVALLVGVMSVSGLMLRKRRRVSNPGRSLSPYDM